MKGSILVGLLLIVVSACSSGSDDRSSETSTARLIPVNGNTVPDSADIAIYWFRGPGGDQSWEAYLTDGGYIESGRAYINGTSTIPPQIVAENYGVAVGIVLVFPEGQTPEYRAYTESDDSIVNTAIGAATRNAYIYKTHDLNPVLSDPGWTFWGDTFPLGFSCARNIERPEDFDQFAATSCSNVELRFAPISELEFAGFDWT